MKYQICGIVLGLVLSITAVAAADNSISMVVNGQKINCDVPPQIINGRTLVPARFIAEALGATVDWDGKNNTVVVTSSATNVKKTHITTALWKNDSSIPSWVESGLNDSAAFVITTQEWSSGEDNKQLDDFVSKAGGEFILQPLGGGVAFPASIIDSFSHEDGSYQGYELKIDPQAEMNMIAGIKYKLMPENFNDDFKWSTDNGVTVTKPLKNPQDDIKEVHIIGCYWHGDSHIPDWLKNFGYDFLISLDEPSTVNSDEPEYYPLTRFMTKADDDFVLRAEGHPDVHIKTNGTCSDTGFIAAAVIISGQEKSKLVPGVSYSLIPSNNTDYKWVVSEGVSVIPQ